MDIRSHSDALQRTRERLLRLLGADALTFTFCARTGAGGRPVNEDSVRFSSDGAHGAFVVADGLGGYCGGELASSMASEAILAGLEAPVTEEAALAQLLCRTNDALLLAQREPGQADMKTTAAALTVEGRHALWAHIGDSRLYRFSGGRCRFVTADHSVSYRKYLHGAIAYEEIARDIDRARLLRALGQPVCRPETGGCRIRSGDAFLLCSDGFWEHVHVREMERDLSGADTPQDWLERMLRRHSARGGGEGDNFSVIAVFAAHKSQSN